MPAKYSNIEQRTPEWLAMRVGLITGTRAAKIVAGSAKEREGVILELIYEISTNKPLPSNVDPQNIHIRRGSETENAHMAAYMFNQKEILADKASLETPGFVTHSDWAWAGCSPDGIIKHDNGLTLVELKAPQDIHYEVETTRPHWVAQTLFNATICECQFAELAQRVYHYEDGEFVDAGQYASDFYGTGAIGKWWVDNVGKLEAAYEEAVERAVLDDGETDTVLSSALAQLAMVADEKAEVMGREKACRDNLISLLDVSGRSMVESNSHTFSKRKGSSRVNYKGLSEYLAKKAKLDFAKESVAFASVSSESWTLKARKQEKS